MNEKYEAIGRVMRDESVALSAKLNAAAGTDVGFTLVVWGINGEPQFVQLAGNIHGEAAEKEMEQRVSAMKRGDMTPIGKAVKQ